MKSVIRDWDIIQEVVERGEVQGHKDQVGHKGQQEQQEMLVVKVAVALLVLRETQ